jgi:protein ImuA
MPLADHSLRMDSPLATADAGLVSGPPLHAAPGPLAVWPAARNRAAPRPVGAGDAAEPDSLADAWALPPVRWHGGDRPDAAGEAGVATGFAALDAQLPGGGWPRRALTELLLPQAGVGELRLLAPALAATVQAGRLVMLFDPPAQLSAWALAQLGIDAEQLLVIDGRSPVLPDASSLWALEQALRSGHVGAVLAWLPPRLRAGRLRRLQLAAQRHDGPAFVLRETAARERPTAAPLRLALQAAGADRLALRLLKRRGPPLESVLQLELPPLRPSAAAFEASRRVGSSKLSGVLGEASRAATRLPPRPLHAARSAMSPADDRASPSRTGTAAEMPLTAAFFALHAAPHEPLRAAVFVDLGG